MGYGSDMGNLYARPKRIERNVRKVIALWGGIALWPRRLTRGGMSFFESVTPWRVTMLRGGWVIGRRREGSTRTSRRV